MRACTLSLFFLGGAVLLAGSASAEDAVTQPGVPEVSIERQKEDDGKVESLQFLKENRAFFRAQLDLLRQTFGAFHYSTGDGLDPRSLMLKELLAQGRAHADSAALATSNGRARTLLDSVAELAELEAEMNRMDEMLTLQTERLAKLEEDFAGRQETALIVLLAGAESRGAPEEILFREEGGDLYRVSLNSAERASLAEGGLAQLFHSFVEPRELHFTVSCRGEGWADAPEARLVVAPERDRLNFLQLNLASFREGNSSTEGAEIPSRHWVR